MTLFFAICIAISSISMSIIFFALTSKDNVIFYSYFKWSWAFYFLGFALAILSSYLSLPFLLIIKGIFDMASLIAFLYAIYHLCHITISDIWTRYAVFTLLWVSITGYLQLDYLIVSIPIVIYNLTMTLFICYTLVKKLHLSVLTNIMAVFFVFVFGICKIWFAFIFETNLSLFNALIFEFFYTVIFTVFISIFSVNLKENFTYTGERFQMMIENSRDAFFHCYLTPKLSFEYITSVITDILGYSPQDFYVNPNLLLQITQSNYTDIVQRIFFDGNCTEDAITETIRCVAKNKEIKDIEIYCTPIYQNDKLNELSGSIRDITALQAAQNNLIEAQQARNRMFSYVSHELKTPITSILGYATAISDGTLTTESEKQRALSVIIDKSIFTKRMIEDLSQLSKLETNQYEFKYEILNASQLAASIEQATITELKNSKINFKYDIEYQLLSKYMIIADEIRICQVALNLISNSIKYTKNKNVITVQCTIDNECDNMIISVADKGMGIKSEDIAYIFNCFFKGEHSSTSQSRGLGLAISKEIINAHGGEISVNSRYGLGSSFTVSLPLYKNNEFVQEE